MDKTQNVAYSTAV